jgi:surface antigen
MLILAVVMGTSRSVTAGSGDNYPKPWRSAPINAYVDTWGYYSRQCTSWVAWALHDRNGFEMPRAIGNAANWGLWATGRYAVNSTPAVGAVAWWRATSANQYGHVAWVKAINGSTVTIEEYNWGSVGTYQIRNIPASSASYIHFKDIRDTTVPITGTPAHSIVAGTQLGTSTVPVRVAWSGADPGSGIARFQVQQRKFAGSAWGAWSFVTSGTTAREITVQRAPGTYQFRVRAQDKAGNWSIWKAGGHFALTAHQETSEAVAYIGRWARATRAGSYGGYVQVARVSQAKARLAFTGRSVAYAGTMAGNRGKAEVRLDGVKVAVVDLYSPSIVTKRLVFARNFASSAPHILEVRVQGTKNAASTSIRVDVDAFVVIR